MSDPFRDQLVEELESYLGHKLFAPEGIHELDLKAILETMSDMSLANDRVNGEDDKW